MKFTAVKPPRTFEVGRGTSITISDCARIRLEPDEQVTFTTEGGIEYDVARKNWGFYAAPSLNGRLLQFGLRAVLVCSPVNRYFIFLVEQGQEAAFEEYLRVEDHSIVCWLDSDAALNDLREKMSRA